MNEEQKRVTMSGLETAIRQQAVNAFRKDLRSSIEATMSKHGVMPSWSLEGKTKELFEAVEEVVKASSSHIGDKAVNIFLQTYGKLIVDFPQIVEDAHELGVEDGIRSSS